MIILLLALLLSACANGGGTMPTEQSTVTLSDITNSSISITIDGGPQTAGPGGPGGTVTMPIMIPVQVGPGGLPTP